MIFKGNEKKPLEKRDDSSKSEIMHRLKTHPFLFIGTVIVLVIVIIAFVFVPAIVPDSRAGGDLIFGYYNKNPIKYVQNNYFARTLQAISQGRQQSEDNPNYMEDLRQAWREAFQEAAIRIGILDEMKQSGFMVPENVVDREMAELPHFQENGRFSSTKYRAMDNASRISLWQQVHENITVRTYLADLMGMRTASGEPEFINSMSSPKRSFDLAVFSLNSYPDSEIISYVESNADIFRTLRLSRVTINSSEREARQVLASIRNGSMTFEDAARNNSQDWSADRGGDIGLVMVFDLGFEIQNERERESVINLARGDISEPVKVYSGWSFYRADEPVRPADLSDSVQMSKVRNYLLYFSRGQAEDWLISEAERFAAHAREIGFDEAIEAANLVKSSFGPIPVNYGNSALFNSIRYSGIPELDSAGTNQFFWRTAFSTPVQTPSAPLVLDSNVIVLFPVEEIVSLEEEAGFIEAYYPYWVSMSLENDYRSYFMNNKKMDDRFQQTFSKLWRED